MSKRTLLHERLVAWMHTKTAGRLGFALTFTLWLAAFYFTFNPDQFVEYGYLGVFVFNLAGPGTLLIPILVLSGLNVLWVAVFTSIGMSMNDSLSFAMGRFSAVAFAKSEKAARILHWVGKYDSLAIFCFALVPFPLDLVAMVVGNAQYPYRKFVVASFMGKCVRAIIVGALTVYFGEEIYVILKNIKSALPF